MIKLKLYIKMLVLILTTSVIIFGTSILVISFNIKSKAYQSSTQYADISAEMNASRVKGHIEKYMTTAKALSYFLLSFDALDQNVRRSNYMKILKSVLTKNQEVLGVWTIWEPNMLDGLDSAYINVLGNTYMGNFSPTYFRDNDSVKLEGLSTGPLYQGDYYTIPKERHEQVLLEPYYYSYLGEKEDEIIQTNLIVPLMLNNQFYGVVGTDASLADLQGFAKKIKPFNNSYAFLIASNGTIVAHHNDGLVGKKYDTLQYGEIDNEQLISELRWKHKLSFTEIDPLTNVQTYFTFSSVTIGDATDNWVFGLAVPVSELNQVARKIFILSIITGLFALVLFSAFIYLLSRSISRPVVSITKVVEEIAIGNIDKSLKIPIKTNDEISDIGNSVNKLIDGLNSTALFAKQIGQGNLNADYQVLSKHDQLGKSLVDMRESLKKAHILEQQKREEDDKQAWVTQGLAKFGEILREDNDNMERFSVNICRNLCEYMKIPQAAMFIVEEAQDKIVYEMKALYAYGSQKLYAKRINEGEEIVGRVISEKSIIHLQNVPERFASVTTGNTNDPIPTHLLFVPMLMNEDPYGAIELMSIDPFEPHHIDFAEKVAVSIAATVSSVKTNLRTAQLLAQSEELKDELSQQEEEMRQNLEEMEATQEEARKREGELTAVKDAFQNLTMMAEYDTEGRIIRINQQMAKAYGHVPDNMIGKFQDAFVTEDDASRRNFLKFWQEVINGVTKKRIHEIVKRDQTIYLNETYIPIMEDERVDRVLNIATDITKKILLDKEITQLMNKITSLKNK